LRENIELVRRVYAIGLDRTQPRSLETALVELRSLLDPGVVFVPEAGRADGVAYRGIDQYLELFERSLEVWERWSYELSEVVPAGEDRILAVGVVMARRRGQEVRSPFATVWTLRAGKATRIEPYPDPPA
jgi:ketosteroid isomerase-like protein